MSLDFHNLKTVSVANGEVTLRIPRRWGVYPDENEEGCWGCYEEGDDHTGTLWIHVHHFDPPEGELPPVSFANKDFVGMMIENSKDEFPPPIESSTTPVDQGYRWFRVYDAEENGEWLRFWYSHFYLGRGAHNAIISFNFVLPHGQMHDPEFVELQDIMEREIGTAFLDPFKAFDEREAEDALGPLCFCNFNDQVTLVLPEAVDFRPHGEDDADNQWYGRLTTDRSHAGMFVLADDFQFAWEEDDIDRAATNEDLDRVALQMFESIFQEVLSEWTDTSGDDTSGRRTPWGAVFYKGSEDKGSYEGNGNSEAEPNAEDRPLRNHLWQVIRHESFKQRRLQILLMVPIAETGTPPYPQLVAYMRRAVFRAQFPGFEEAESY